jgi:DEAD/DEAH box helicase domain-containing protein
MPFNLKYLSNAYHKIIKYEYEKYRKTGKIGDTFLTYEEIRSLGISDDVLSNLIKEGFVIKVSQNLYHSLLMDVAYRASDIRIKYGGTKYVLESSLDLQLRPFCSFEYVNFSKNDQNLEELKKEFSKIIPADLVDKFIEALIDAGLKGLSKYQFLSILQFLREDKNVVICAPTAFGKTYIFLIPILLFAIKSVLEGRKGVVAVLFYPRKSLGSDQMGRLIRIVYYLNRELNLNISIGIDDGDVKEKRKIRNFDEYRGIMCPVHKDEKLLVKDGKVFCRKCNDSFKFIALTREDFKQHPPTILITNIWAYQFRLCDPIYWKNGYLSENIQFLVFDEVHAYRSINAGILRYFVHILRSLVTPKGRLVFSSATIPKFEEFIQEISGLSLADFINLVYNEKTHGVDEHKLELYLLIAIHPFTSWETYIHELAIFLSTVNRIRTKKNLQSLIFVDGIRSISRIYTQLLEAVKLGDPRDHLHPDLSPEDAFCYWVYNEEYKMSGESKEELDLLRESIKGNVEVHFSDRVDRFDVERRIKSGAIDVVFTTSTLELGVDYDNVSVVVNAGIPFSLESIIQRVGRAGRNEETTLRSSLCIIVVRNNPLEYFYIYKGIRELTDINKIPKIPVSYSNVFVASYSALLYTLAYYGKRGGDLLRLRGSKEIAYMILDKTSSILPQIVRDLGISVDIKDIIEELKKITQILLQPNVEDRFKNIKYWKERVWLLNELNSFIDEFNNLLISMENELDKLSLREKKLLTEKIGRLKLELLKMREGVKKVDLDIIKESVSEVIQNLMDIRSSIRVEYHPLYSFEGDLVELDYKLVKYFKPQIVILSKVKGVDGVSDEEFVKYYKAEEMYKKLSEHPINLVESMIGFRFMGNEFIDQLVTIGAELYTQTSKKEEFLSDVISRTPPFEPITIPFEERTQREITSCVGARHFWLVKPQKGFYIFPSEIYKKVATNDLIKGEAEKYKDMLIPSQIDFLDMLTLEKAFIFKMQCKDGKPLYIKYGSEKINTSKIDGGKYLLYKNIGKLYQLEVTNGLYDVIKNKTINYLQRIDNEIQNSGDKWGLNFRYPYICFLGYCISVDPFDKSCPIAKTECIVIGCDGNKHWSGRIRKRRIFPKFYVNMNVRNLPQVDEPLTYHVKTMTYDELREDVEFVYDKVTVYLPRGFNDYLLREFEICPLGYLARTSLICLMFNQTLLDIILLNILRERNDIVNLLKFKFYMYRKLLEKGSYIDAALDYVKYDATKVETNSMEFINFVRECLIHTIAHLFFIFLITKKVQVDPDRITYFVKGSSIYVLEKSKNDGIGLVETVRNEIKSVGEKRFMEEFIEWSIDFLEKHDRRMEDDSKILMSDSKNYLSKLSSQQEVRDKIVALQKKIGELNEKINSHIKLDFIDIVTYRHILSQELMKWEEYSDDLSEYLLPIIHSEGVPKLCADGCEDCLILYRGCTEPFLQNYIISRNLTITFLKIFKRGHLTFIGKGFGEFLKKLMKKSEKVIVKVPFIDDYGLSILLECKKSGVNVEVLTRPDNPYINELEKHGIRVTTHLTHAKVYLLLFGKQKISIHGSMNLTRSSFMENEENVVILWDDDHKATLPGDCD